jgi:hypothetical protein
MLTINIKLDFEQDAWNWWEACNKVSQGVDWKQKIPIELREKITDKSQAEAYNFLLPYLQELYSKLEVEKYLNEMQTGFDKVKDKLFERMEKVTNRPIYRNNFTCFSTSFPRFPYDYENGYVWISNKRKLEYQIQIFIHELLHFQYFKYFGEKVWDEIGSEKHAELKEAMTIIIDEEFKDITTVQDEGYEIHKNLRKKLLEVWLATKNMDEFIERSINLMK